MMGTLREVVEDTSKRREVVQDACGALDEEVASKGGFSGMALKTAYKLAKGVAPDIMPRIIDKLLNDFLDALQPFHDEAVSKGADVAQHMASRKGDVAEALLQITDTRAARADAGALKKGYGKLRPSALKHVEAGVPRLTKTLSKHF
jgi:hypothetical protein